MNASEIQIENAENVVELLRANAAARPAQVAVAEPSRGGHWRSISFLDLERDSRQIASGLRQLGVRNGTRVALLVPPGIRFVTMVFALFRSGAVTILIDPGIGRANLVRCLAQAHPHGLVGVRRAHIARWLLRRHFPDLHLKVAVGGCFPGCASLEQVRRLGALDHDRWKIEADDPAAIIFTTGSTGPPKGVLYRHRHFLHQAWQLREYFEIQPGGVDLSSFPLFALFNSGLGTTTVFPKMDFARPARIDPRNFLAAARYWRADQSFGSPALWNTVYRYCHPRGIRLESMLRVASAGAPVPVHVIQGVKSLISPDGEVFTPYGATESLPIACIGASSILAETARITSQGGGTCVGNRFSGIQWMIIEISDDPITSIGNVRPQPTGSIGELIVRGPVVTDQYVTAPGANALHKIPDGDGYWHRMGDVGYLDEQERFWFCGRKSHRVTTTSGTMFTIPCEAIFNNHPAIHRSALVGVGEPGAQVPVVFAEPWPENWPRTKARQRYLIDELAQLGGQNERTCAVERIFLCRALPVDIRHNAKIFRERLAVRAAQLLRGSAGHSR